MDWYEIQILCMRLRRDGNIDLVEGPIRFEGFFINGDLGLNVL